MVVFIKMKFMKRFFCITCIGIIWLMVFSGSLKAQDNTRDYVILLSGQKLFGQVVRDFDYNRYTSINFLNLLGERFTYNPEDIQGFGLNNGRLFYSKYLPGIKEKVFVQQLLTGTLSLINYQGKFFVVGEKEITELLAGYDDMKFDSRTLKTYKKPFIGTLNILLAGTCGFQLSYLINRANYTEQDFLDILSKYHICEGLDYSIHVGKIKRLRVSPSLGAGYSIFQTIVNNRSQGRNDILEKSGMPFFQAGVKVYQFRNYPKIGFDFGFGFAASNNTIDSEYINSEVTLTGTEQFKMTSVFVPLFFNYSLLRKKDIESYIGIGGLYRSNVSESTFAIRDLTTNYNATTVLEEKPFMVLNNNMINPALKLGTHFNSSKKLGFLLELQLEYASSAFTSDLELNKATYNQLMSSFLFAIRY
jgi:hypothetical protein